METVDRRTKKVSDYRAQLRCACKARKNAREFAPRQGIKYLLYQQLSCWRRGWDSNPRYGYPVQRFSRPSRSTTPAPLRTNQIKHLKTSALATKRETGTGLAPDYRFSTASMASAAVLPWSRNICP
jgi:hypothetical protein